MKITVMRVGKSKETYWNDAAAEYAKRLSRYCTLDDIVVADEKTPENASAKEEESIKAREGERLLKRMPKDAYVIALAIDGKTMDSLAFAEEIRQFEIKGTPHIAFVIGGSLGLSEEVSARADEQISFSAMTFPHQLMRVILLEQIYRGYRIIRGEPYHK